MLLLEHFLNDISSSFYGNTLLHTFVSNWEIWLKFVWRLVEDAWQEFEAPTQSYNNPTILWEQGKQPRSVIILITDPPPTSSTTLSPPKKIIKRLWHMKPDTWKLTLDIWHVTHYTWHVTHGGGEQLLNSNSFGFMMSWILGGKGWPTKSINQWISFKAVWRTAPATPGRTWFLVRQAIFVLPGGMQVR